MGAQNDPETAPLPADGTDLITQIQDEIASLCARFFNFIGALQRDAPPVPSAGEFSAEQQPPALQDQIQIMRMEISEGIATLGTLINRLPDLTGTLEDRQWQEAAELEAADEQTTATLRETLRVAEAKLDALQRAHGALTDAVLLKTRTAAAAGTARQR